MSLVDIEDELYETLSKYIDGPNRFSGKKGYVNDRINKCLEIDQSGGEIGDVAKVRKETEEKISKARKEAVQNNGNNSFQMKDILILLVVFLISNSTVALFILYGVM